MVDEEGLDTTTCPEQSPPLSGLNGRGTAGFGSLWEELEWTRACRENADGRFPGRSSAFANGSDGQLRESKRTYGWRPSSKVGG